MKSYVLVSAAYNEEAFIDGTIKSVVSQTVLPKRWVIVSDGSVDHTDEIVRRYAEHYQFIELLCIVDRHTRDFRSKVCALNAGIERLKGLDYEYIGNLDADVSFDESYFANLLAHFDRDPSLGLAGGFIFEKCNGLFKSRGSNRSHSVAGAIQLFRRECFEALGSHFVPFKYGGEDWFAEVAAQMSGWRVQAFPELRVLHHRQTGRGVGLFRYSYRQGITDAAFGCYPLFVFLKCMLRLNEKPYVIGALSRLAGFSWAYCGQEKWVSKHVAQFLSKQQKKRLQSLKVFGWHSHSSAADVPHSVHAGKIDRPG